MQHLGLLFLLSVVLATSACAQAPRISQPPSPAAENPLERVPMPPPRPRLPPQVRVNERTIYYDVRGDSSQEILASIRANSPIEEKGVDGRSLDAYMRWRIDWRYRFQQRNDACRFTNVTVTANLTTTLWRWTPSANASASLISEWRRRARILLEHEDGHRNYTLLGARQIFSALRPMQAPTCDALQDKADTEGRRILDTIRDINRRYDEVTLHGTIEPK
ncbi:MAG: DUF922 domain-containing protein [Bacteroidota bacterium]